MAWEQILGHPVSVQTNVYSLGVVMYEMLTGRRPFTDSDTGSESSGATAKEWIRYTHMQLAPPNPHNHNPKIPEELSNVIFRTPARSWINIHYSLRWTN